MRKSLLLSALFLAGCSAECPKQAAAPPMPAPQAPISEADAAAFIDKVPAALIAKDVPGAIALYADNAVALDPMSPDVITTKEANTASTNGFLSGNVTKLTLNERHVQILDADTFIATQLVTIDMMPGKKAEQSMMRITDVVEKDGAGAWKIVNEHLSAMPAAPKAKLPVLKEWTPPAAPAAPASPTSAPAPAPAAPAKPT